MDKNVPAYNYAGRRNRGTTLACEMNVSQNKGSYDMR